MAKGMYTEPSNYFPKEIRKEFGLGEYAKKEKAGSTKKSNTTKKSK